MPYALVVLALVVAAGFYLVHAGGSPKFAFIWAIVIALGLTVQRARFCFTASMRDPVLTGSTSLTKAVVIGLAVGTVGFSAIQLGAYFKTGQLADAMKLAGLEPVGMHTVVGGFLFGLGAVIAGGCASGTLLRIGDRRRDVASLEGRLPRGAEGGRLPADGAGRLRACPGAPVRALARGLAARRLVGQAQRKASSLRGE